MESQKVWPEFSHSRSNDVKVMFAHSYSENSHKRANENNML